MTVIIHPLQDRVLVKLRPLPEQTGLIVRVARNEIAREADVLAVGPECRDVREGQGVLVNVLTGTEFGDGLLVPEGSILGFLE